MQQQLFKATEVMAEKIGGMSRPSSTLMDVRGLGKPGPFNNRQESWAKWSRSLENFVIGTIGDEFRPLMEHAAESEAELQGKDVDDLFGENADDLDKIE